MGKQHEGQASLPAISAHTLMPGSPEAAVHQELSLAETKPSCCLQQLLTTLHLAQQNNKQTSSEVQPLLPH